MNKAKKLMLIISLIIAFTSSVFSFTVYADTDKVSLIEARDAAQTAVNTQEASPADDLYYETNSYQAFVDQINNLGGFVGIQAVIDDPVALQADIDALTSSIVAATSGLILKDTYLLATSNHALAKMIDITNYTPNSQGLYNQELDRIALILNDYQAGEAAIQNAIIDISKAIELLTPIVDKTDLQLLNNILIRIYYEERELYTASSHNAFKATIDALGSYLYVNSVIADDNASQTLVDNLEMTIQNALDDLVLIVDNSNLLQVYYQLLNEDLSGYTLDSKTEYYDVLDSLYEIIIGDELDDATASAVLTDLAEVNELLVDLPDYTLLQKAINVSAIYREEDYSVSSYSIFSQAKEHGERVLRDLNATQEEVDLAIDKLKQAIDMLDQKLEPIYIREGQTLDIKEYVVLGDETIVQYIIVHKDVLMINSQGIATGLKYGDTKVYVELSNGAIEVIHFVITAKITPVVYVLTFSIPVVTLGLAALLTYSNKEGWNKAFTKIKQIFKKKQK